MFYCSQLKLPFIALIVLSLLVIGTNYQEEKNDKQTKVDACVKLIRARIDQDRAYYSEIIQYYSATGNQEEAINKFFSLALLTCYNSINFFDADEMDKKSSINALSKENKALLGLEKWENLLKENNEEAIQMEMANLNEALAEIKSDDVDLSKINGDGKEKYKKPEKGYDENMDRIYIQGDKEMGFNIFGFDFTKLSNRNKNILGFSLIILIFVVVIYGLKKINDIRNEGKSLKKKKKKIK